MDVLRALVKSGSADVASGLGLGLVLGLGIDLGLVIQLGGRFTKLQRYPLRHPLIHFSPWPQSTKLRSKYVLTSELDFRSAKLLTFWLEYVLRPNVCSANCLSES